MLFTLNGRALSLSLPPHCVHLWPQYHSNVLKITLAKLLLCFLWLKQVCFGRGCFFVVAITQHDINDWSYIDVVLETFNSSPGIVMQNCVSGTLQTSPGSWAELEDHIQGLNTGGDEKWTNQSELFIYCTWDKNKFKTKSFKPFLKSLLFFLPRLLIDFVQGSLSRLLLSLTGIHGYGTAALRDDKVQPLLLWVMQMTALFHHIQIRLLQHRWQQ